MVDGRTVERLSELAVWTNGQTDGGRTGTTNQRTNTVFRLSVGVVRGVFPYRR